MRTFILATFLFFTPLLSYASTDYTLNVPTVGLVAPLLVSNDVTCSGVGGWSKNPVYSSPSGVPTISAENTYKFTGGFNAYPSYASAVAAFGGDSQYIFHCANPSKIVWYNLYGYVLGDTDVQVSDFTINMGEFNTRFTGVSNIQYSTSTGLLTFDVSQYVDSDEIDINNPARFITGHKVTYGLSSIGGNPGSTVSEYYVASSTFPTGNSTSSLRAATYITADGTYTFMVEFANPRSFFTQVIPFVETNVYFDVVIVDGVIVGTNVDVMTNTVVPTQYQPCGIADLGGCLVNTIRFLFVPSISSVSSLTSLVSSSTIPFVASAYMSYEVTKAALSTSQNSSSTLTYTFEIPEAGISVPMLSAATITGGLGSAAPMFRGIALVVLVFGFLTMITRTISSHIGVQVEPQGDYINKRSGISR